MNTVLNVEPTRAYYLRAQVTLLAGANPGGGGGDALICQRA
jgi:hypothetical protein